MSIVWKVDATPMPMIPSWLCRWSDRNNELSSSDTFSKEELSIIVKHLGKNTRFAIMTDINCTVTETLYSRTSIIQTPLDQAK